MRSPYHDAYEPLMRGWLHAIAAVVALLLVLSVFVRIAEPGHRLAMLVFGSSMVLLYGVSALYHIGRWGPRTHRILRSFDHANIFVLIAGTYTPFCVMVLRGPVATFLLISLWSIAAVGVILKIGWPYVSRRFSVSCYVAMGWLGVVAVPQLVQTLPQPALLLLLSGGLLYTTGGIIYALRRPNPLPRFFGYHELFHLLGVSANTSFVLTILLWVLPYAQS